MPAAAALTLGGAGLALAGDDPKPSPRPALVNVRAAAPIEVPPPPMFLPGGHDIGPFGYDKEFATELATELGISEDKVVAGVRKVLENRFNKRRDEALKCYDDPKECKAAFDEKIKALKALPVPARPARSSKKP